MADAISLRTGCSYTGIPSDEDLEAAKQDLLTRLDIWKQQVQSGQIVALLAVAIGPDFACRTYCGLDENLSNVVEVGAVRYLVKDIERRVMGE